MKWHPWDDTPAELLPVVVLGDGAKWIWEHVAPLFGDERTEIVDWYHASVHLWTAARALHGEDTPETKAWATTALDHLWQSGPKPVLEWFDATQADTTAAGEVMKRERGYFSTNAARAGINPAQNPISAAPDGTSACAIAFRVANMRAIICAEPTSSAHIHATQSRPATNVEDYHQAGAQS